ncbi:hypothetical protein BTO06_15540 [Tenacibaculum sp. SZ-18]|uniref:hypothetical protein n=1 Tax=Tenacibaculum sp. SZ-18 TaxID=754423 RepID=UPI000C2D58C2|nr:hypothetical protein [Tenacibaculum sp. SZ-18]AUC16475.1 hypothetical protein BTO06_15540 [Tenacibaculum sp. SZ-18]
MTQKVFFFFFFISLLGFGQKKLKEFRSKKLTLKSDTIQIDSVSINPTFFKLFSKDGKEISKEQYQVDFVKSKLFIKSDSFPEVIMEYLRYPAFLTKKYSLLDKRLIVPNSTNTSEQLYSLTTNKKKTRNDFFDGLKTSGFISRGVTSGNNQNAVTNATLDLTIEGKLSKDVSIRANIFDTNFPLQQGGYSQNITDFNRVFVELYNKNWKVKGGDVSLANKDSYFLNFDKQVSGLQAEADISKNFRASASGAIVRGRFTAFNFVGTEGNQGPYKIFGPNNESAIVIVEGSDAVFVNGNRLERGENKDYVIDYNLAEVRFNTKYPVTNDMRVRIEFQFSDRNYTRFITYEKAQYKGEKLSISGYFYNENDAKSQPIQQNLTDEQKEILANAGNDITQMVSPSAFIDEFSPNRIQYRKVDNNGVSIFEFSTDENEELYTVTFSNVGINNGSYRIDRTIATGTIYQYVGPNLGSFEPSVRLVPPTSLQVAVVNSNYNPSEKTNISAELAYSNNDQNLFSSIDDEKNQQIASKLNWKQTILDGSWKLKSNLDYEFVQQNFRTVQRFRTVEFNRDWNLRSAVGNQNQLATTFRLEKEKNNFVSYGFNYLNFSESFNGNKHEIQSRLSNKNSVFNLKGSMLQNTSTIEKDEFFRLYSNYEKRFKKTWIGGLVNFETNEIKDRNTNTFNNLSHQFQEYEGYFGIGDSTKVFAKVGLNYRTNDSIKSNLFTRINNRNTVYLDSRIIQNKTTNLSVYANYRYTDEKFSENEQSLNSRIVYNQRFFKNGLTIGTVYETSSGNIARQDFIYVKTEPGQGFYTWIDYNNDGIQQFEEFEIAQFQDQAEYLRVPLPNLTFLPTQRASWKQSITLNPKLWKSKKGVRKWLSYFYNQTYFLINNEQRRVGDSFNLNPFDLNEDQLVGLQFNFRNSIYFNRNLQNYSWIYTFGKSRNKQQFTIGNQENNTITHQIDFKHKVGKFWLFEATSSLSENKLSTENFANRNYNLRNKELNPKLTYLYNKDHRLSAFYHFKNKENTVAGLENLSQQKLGIEYYYINEKRNQISANFNMFLNNFRGDTNSPVGYQMLEGLQVGRNFTWSALITQKLNSFLNLNLNYFGRKSEASKTIHTGMVQLKAIF